MLCVILCLFFRDPLFTQVMNFAIRALSHPAIQVLIDIRIVISIKSKHNLY